MRRQLHGPKEGGERSSTSERVFFGNDAYGTIVHGEDAVAFLQGIPEGSRLLTALEVVAIRIAVFDRLASLMPGLQKSAASISKRQNITDQKGKLSRSIPQEDVTVMGSTMAIMKGNPGQYAIWGEDLMTDTYLVTANERVSVIHGNPFASRQQRLDAFSGNITDGGVECPKDIVEQIAQNHSVFSFPLSDYQDRAKGGNFPMEEFIQHPHTLGVLGNGDPVLVRRYMTRSLVLSVLTSLGRPTCATWQTARKNRQVRQVRLGSTANPGEFIYPANAQTLNWQGIVVAHDFDVSRFLEQAEKLPESSLRLLERFTPARGTPHRRTR